MLPSKAERILSRYRPIAPKPLPLPPSGSYGTTDPSSTCASVDSFTSSAKCKRSRKRKADDFSSARGLKAPKLITSGLSNTGAASSLTQGVSDGTVPLTDLRSASQVSYGSGPFGMEDGTEMSNGTSKEVKGMAAELRFAAYKGVVSPMYVGDAGKVAQAQGLFMSAESAQQQHQFAMMHQQLSPSCNPNCVPIINKDGGFMERPAAAPASVLLERPASLPVCDVGERPASLPLCDVGFAKGVGYGGGGFTEMIRGITRLPTAADVQSLMQARASSSPVAGQASTTVEALCGSLTSSREMTQQLLDPPCHNWIAGLSLRADAEQVCEGNEDLVTLPLLPNIPSRMCSVSSPSAMVSGRVGSQVHSPPHNMGSSWHHQVSPRVEQPPEALATSRNSSLSHSGVHFVSGCPLFPALPKQVMPGLMVPSMSVQGMQVAASAVMADGAAIDERYLDHVYGGSTDPVLLVDNDNNKVLWYNKPYDKALKSASERLTGKAVQAGPYIDPLGHPTPLGSFVFPVYGKSVRATLWGFLKKLVTQECKLLSEHGSYGSSSQVRPSGDVALEILTSEPLSRFGPVVCSSNSRVTTVSLESITEFHMDAPATVECVDAAEARLDAAGVEPAFITDCLNRVRWVNASLKQMLGHMSSDCSRSHIASSSKDPCGSPSGRLAETPAFVMCCTEKVPRSAWAFSCRVNLEWIKGGRRRSMTVPCDVARLASNTRASEVHWVWQFDMAVSLCLNAPS